MFTSSPIRRAAALLAVFTCLPLAASAEDPLEHEFDLYWGEQRDITNIHKRLFQKDGRHEISIFGGVIPNDDFFVYYPVGLKYDYYFSEDFALEVSGAYLIGVNSELEDFIETTLAPGSYEVNLPQALEWKAGAGVMWTPVYGKFGAFATKLAHFDFGIALGIDVLGTKVAKTGATVTEQSRIDVGGNVGATVRFFVWDFIAIRLDYRHTFYNGRNAEDESRGLSHAAEITLGLGFWTPEPN